MATVRPAAPEGPGPYGPVGRSPWLDIVWSAHQRWVTVAGRPVNVCEIGPEDGDPLVFVHGLSGSWQNWLENLPVLAEAGFRCIAPDLPGFGQSPMPAEKITITRYGELLDELLETLGIDAAVIVGNSMGGFIAAEVAIRFPQRVERLVLVSAAGLSIEDLRNDRGQAILERLDFVLSAYAGWFASKSAFVARRERLRRAAFSIVAAYPEKLPALLVEENLRGSGKPGFVAAVEALTTYPIQERLPEIACPTLIVWGTRDRLVPVKDAHEFARLIPDSRKVIYPDTGHVAMLERPAAFNALVAAFIAEKPNEDVVQPAVA
ncbi:MAG: alpha/beta hydrolase [Solirubrobacterales bacterium]|jgi:pimeloyl-ACP methyl ester carboxylesterase|nr:alpha/beta hydrolase [Solirubrobacterales bacterium]